MTKKKLTKKEQKLAKEKSERINKGANAWMRAKRRVRSLTLVDNRKDPENQLMGDYIRLASGHDLDLSPEETKALAKAEAEFDAEAEAGGDRHPIDANAGAGTGTAPGGRRKIDMNERMRDIVAFRRSAGGK